MSEISNNFRSTKFIMTILIIGILTLFVILDKMTSEQFVILLPIISGSYIAGNVTEKFLKEKPNV